MQLSSMQILSSAVKDFLVELSLISSGEWNGIFWFTAPDWKILCRKFRKRKQPRKLYPKFQNVWPKISVPFGLLAEWFAFRNFSGFWFLWKLYQDISVTFAPVPKLLVEWNTYILYTFSHQTLRHTEMTNQKRFHCFNQLEWTVVQSSPELFSYRWECFERENGQRLMYQICEVFKQLAMSLNDTKGWKKKHVSTQQHIICVAIVLLNPTGEWFVLKTFGIRYESLHALTE